MKITNSGVMPYGLAIDSTGAAMVRTAPSGDKFKINTGVINLTTAGESSILYYKHFEDMPLVLDSIVVALENNSTDVNPTCLFTIVKNPTTGTLISNAAAVSIKSNCNFGSVNELANSLAYKGAEGYTVTNGDAWDLDFIASGKNTILLDVTLNKGNSIAFKIDLQANAATDLDVYAALNCHFN